MKWLFKILLVLILVLSAHNGYANSHEEKKPEEKKEEPEKKVFRVKKIKGEELRKAMDGPLKLVIIDVRPEKDYKKAHLHLAENLPFASLKQEDLEKINPDKKTKLVFYSADEESEDSTEAAAKAIEFGYEKVYNYVPGFKEWKSAGYAVFP